MNDIHRVGAPEGEGLRPPVRRKPDDPRPGWFRRRWSWYEARGRWHNLRTLGTSPIVRASVVMPVVGYLILLNEQVQNFVDLAPQYRILTTGSPWRLIVLYYGTFSLAAASVLFAIYCPAPCRRYETAVDYANAEAPFFTASPRIMQRLMSKRLEDRPESKALIDLKLATDNVNVTLGPSPYDRRLEATYVVLDQYWHMLDPDQRGMRLTCRILYDIGLVLVAIPAVTTFAGVLDYLVGGWLFR